MAKTIQQDALIIYHIPLTPTRFAMNYRLPACTLAVALLLSMSLWVGCDSVEDNGPDTASTEWVGTWNVLSTTVQTDIGEITTGYDELGRSVYWTLGTDRVEEISAMDGMEGCGRVRSNVLAVNGRVVTLDNGLHVYDVEYVVSGDQLTATVVASDDEPDLVGARWEAVAVDGEARTLAGC